MSESISTLKGIGEKTEKLFSKLGVNSIQDLLQFYPRGYDVMPPILKEIPPSSKEKVCLKLTVSSSPTLKKIRDLSILHFYATCENGSLNTERIGITFFRMPYLLKVFQPGKTFVFIGKIENKKMEHPAFFKIEEYLSLMNTIQPIYTTTKGLSNATIKKAITNALQKVDSFYDYLPLWIKENASLPDYSYAIEKIHFPNNEDELALARKRLSFDEFFYFLLLIRKNKLSSNSLKTDFPMIETAECKRFIESLPYHLTKDQNQTIVDIVNDMTSGFVMSRMIQGDVGSGKTILAFYSILLCASNGYASALMAPTEVLARQHFDLLMKMNEQYHLNLHPVFLSGSVTGKKRAQVNEEISSGQANVIIGTHALLEDTVDYQKLALVITDEQHRFGVNQREALTKRGKRAHVLVMSATPIPRSLAMILYGDLSISLIKEMPANRLPIKNCVVSEQKREASYRFIEKEVASGHQAYIICPMVEESESDSRFANYTDVTSYAKKIRSFFPETIRIGVLHGKMKNSMKNQIMQDFHDKKYDILVSTTVVEVGVDVKNATVMMIEDAQIFGLAALHQLRGRVGRNSMQSYCIFVDTSKSDETNERLSILNASNDGFEIAEKDLALRGPGDLFGNMQSGELVFSIADIYQDAESLKLASRIVDQIYNGESDITLDELPLFIGNLEKAIGKELNAFTL